MSVIKLLDFCEHRELNACRVNEVLYLFNSLYPSEKHSILIKFEHLTPVQKPQDGIICMTNSYRPSEWEGDHCIQPSHQEKQDLASYLHLVTDMMGFAKEELSRK